MSDEVNELLNRGSINVVRATFKKRPKQTSPTHDSGEGAGAAEFSDPKACFLDDLYKQHWHDLCGWLYRRYGPGPPEPEDIAQEAFSKISALEDITNLTGTESNARAFLFTTAVNTALMAIRKLATQQRFIGEELRNHDLELEEISPERIYSSKQYFEKLKDILNELPAKQKELVIRNRLKGQSYDTIRAATGWSPADISRQLNAALKTIEERLYGPNRTQDMPKDTDNE